MHSHRSHACLLRKCAFTASAGNYHVHDVGVLRVSTLPDPCLTASMCLEASSLSLSSALVLSARSLRSGVGCRGLGFQTFKGLGFRVWA